MKNFIMRPKAIHDEMGGSFDELGRMAAKLGLEVVSPSAANANFILQNYVDPPTELMESGEVQIWKITHNGVDTHPVHFHLFDVQVLNRVAWDGIITLPDLNELGWKDTVRINPLMDTIVAMRAALPVVPFALPSSVRPLNPAAPLGSTMGFSQINTVDGGPLATPMTNSLYDFGHEYVWHCHILAHEENDMMRSISARVPTAPPAAPSGLTATATGAGLSRIDLAWADASTNETGFLIQRRTGTGAFSDVATVYSNMTTYTDTALARNTSYRYRVFAFNMAGSSPASNVTPSVTTGTFPDATGVTLTPSLSSPQVIGTAVNFVAAATGGTGNYQYEFQDITGGGNTLVQAYGVNPTYRWYTDGLAAGTYSFRVNARCVGTTTAVTATVTFTLGVATPNTVALTSSLPSPQFSGTSVTFTAAASGGLGTYEYQFSDNVSGAMTVVQPYSASSAFVWNTTSVPAGTYQFQVTARNAGSTSAAEATGTPLPFTLQAPIGATLTVSPPSPQPSGYYLAFVAVASG
ncbi:MAG TPA: multicopper oxidase domain-containing protein, partial [Thermodesulfobacteriota bacterium]|nr:multicopper oxidase domain-containing protein [Thermodesulfobacteriota bacterium]